MLSLRSSQDQKSFNHPIKKSFCKFQACLVGFMALFLLMLTSSYAQIPPNKLVVSSETGAVDPFFNAAQQTQNFQAKYYESCTVFVYIRSLGRVEVKGLSTFKVSSCPDDQFRRITAASIRAQLRTIAPVGLVSLVGPHYSMMDENNSVVSDAYIELGNLRFSEITSSEVTLRDALTRYDSFSGWYNIKTVYNGIRTKQDVKYTWYEGSTIYLLVTDKGEYYIMTEFNPGQLMKTAEMNLDRLEKLGTVLNLPKGWTYKSVKINSILRYVGIKAQGYQSVLMRDELDNLYQLVEDDIALDVIKDALASSK